MRKSKWKAEHMLSPLELVTEAQHHLGAGNLSRVYILLTKARLRLEAQEREEAAP